MKTGRVVSILRHTPTVLIHKDDTIADVPIVRVRDALRRIAGGRNHLYPQALAQYAKISLLGAERVVDALVIQGRLLPGQADRDGSQFYDFTTAGYGLANASAGRRFKRATAQRALDEVLQRAEALNANPHARDGVGEIVLFGRHGRRPGPDDPILKDDVLPYLEGGKAVLSRVELEQHEALLKTVPNKIIWTRKEGTRP